MKKRTDEEKLQMVNEACDLINEARENLRKARKMLHLCGIKTCDGVNEEDVEPWHLAGSNIQIYSGIRKFEDITGENAYHIEDYLTEKVDKSRKFIRYKEIIFVQVASKETSKYSYR